MGTELAIDLCPAGRSPAGKRPIDEKPCSQQLITDHLPLVRQSSRRLYLSWGGKSFEIHDLCAYGASHYGTTGPDSQIAWITLRIAAQLRHLPERERHLIELCYYEGKTLNQAAAETGFRRCWASRLHARALATLRAAIENQPSNRLAGRARDLRNQIDCPPAGSSRA